MTLFLLFLQSFVVAFSGAAMPGPLLAFTITKCSRKGFWMSPLIIVGHSLLEIAIVIGLVFGLSRFLGNRTVQGVIGLAGGAFLLWMGVTMLKSVPGLTLTLETAPQERAVGGPVLGGILLSLSNPYWTIWWVTLGLALLTRANEFGPAGLTSFYFGHILGDFVWYGFVALMVTLGRRLITDKVYRVIIAICSVFLIFLGAVFVYSGIKSLLPV